MSKRKSRSLAFRVTVIVVAAYIVTSFISSVILDEVLKAKIQRESEQNVSALTQSYSEAITAKIAQISGQLTGYTFSEEILSADEDRITEFLINAKYLRPSSSDYIAYVNKEGEMINDGGGHSNVKDTDYFSAIFNKNFREYTGKPSTSTVTGKTSIFIAKAVMNSGKAQGFILSTVNAGVIQDAFEKLNLYNGKAVVTSGDEFVVSADSRRDGYEILSKDLIVTQEDDLGKWCKDPDTGEVYFISSKRIGSSNWILNYIVTKDAITSLGKTITLLQVETSLVLAILLPILIMLIITLALRPLKLVSRSINEIASGKADLTKRITLKSKHRDEVGNVVDGFNTFTEKLQSIIASLKDSKEQLSGTGFKLITSTEGTAEAITTVVSNIENVGQSIQSQTGSVEETAETISQISKNINRLHKMVEEQSDSVTEASSAVEQMLGNINSVNRSIDIMSQAFNNLNEKSSDGIAKQNIAYQMIKSVEEESKILVQANAIISSISSQTNLLAMNAAIEAAHAGQAGRGFSVVADEIRKLSETSSVQTKTIGKQLRKITETISAVVDSSQAAQDSLSGVFGELSKTDSLVQEINLAMKEQEEGSKQIIETLKHMNNSTSDVSSASVEMSEGTQKILEEVKTLENTSATMKDAMEQMSKNVALIDEAGSDLRSLSDMVSNSIVDIGTQVDQFTI